MSTDTKQRILQATIELLYENFSGDIRTRKIAETAGVNIAAIHYYYGTKEDLVALAVDTVTTQGMEAWTVANLNFDSIERPDLVAFIRFLFESTIQYENMAKTRMTNLMSGRLVNATQMQVYETLDRLLICLLPDAPDDQRRMKANLIYSAAVSLACSMFETNAFLGGDLAEEENLERYVELLVDTVL